jgi:hypothetical protein
MEVIAGATGRAAGHYAAQQRDGLLNPVDWRQCKILMLDRQRVAITDRGECLAEPAAPGFVMAAAKADVVPGPVREVLRRPDLDAPLQRERLWLEEGVLGVDVVDGRPQRRDRGRADRRCELV